MLCYWDNITDDQTISVGYILELDRCLPDNMETILGIRFFLLVVMDSSFGHLWDRDLLFPSLGSLYYSYNQIALGFHHLHDHLGDR